MINPSAALRCQIQAVTDYACQSSSLDLAELRALATQLHHATTRIGAEISKRAGHPNDDWNMFG
jgi:hypothetical protein